MEMDGLFLHGRLREGGPDHRWLARTHPQGACRAWTPGRLFHLGDSLEAALVPCPPPEAPPPGSGWVVGEFVGYEDSTSLHQAVENLDALLGAQEERYSRAPIVVMLEGGQIYKAWAWVFHVERLPRLEREAVEIQDGDWSPYL